MKLILFIILIFAALWGCGYVSIYAESKKHSWISALLLFLCSPFSFLSYVKEEEMITRRWIRVPLVLLSPLFLIPILIVVFIVVLALNMSSAEEGVPESISYHNAYDLQKATGVEFPEVIAVDSTYYNSLAYYTRVKLVPKEPLTAEFFSRLDKACKEDSVCWTKDKEGYKYLIYPVDNLDRTKKDVVPYRVVDTGTSSKPEKTMDWQGRYIEVIVPIKGDTITIEDGWHN